MAKIEPKIFDELKTALVSFGDKYFVGEELNRSKLTDDLRNYDEALLSKLFEVDFIKQHFIKEVAGQKLFQIEQLEEAVLYNDYWDTSYTKYENRVGLASKGKFLQDSQDVVLDFPFKDGVLTASMTKEDKEDGYDDAFLNEVIEKDEIDRLFDKKIFVNSKRYDGNGESTAADFNEDRDNLIIKGNNLLALHAIKDKYAGKVKLIYIDPPYNTGNDSFMYNDRFNHSTWLNFIYNRLSIANELLSEVGSIWLNIDDDESHYLKVLCDELFGRENFIGNIIWEKKFSPQNDATFFSDMHDHILVYCKNIDKFKINLLARTEKMNERYKNPDNDPRGPWSSSDLTVRTYSKEYDYPIETPSGKIINPPKGRCWRTSKENLSKLISQNRIWFGESGDNVPRLKRFLTDVKQGLTPGTIWKHQEVSHNQEARKEISRLFEDTEYDFSTPKPEKLLQRIIHIGSNEGDLVLDFFMGSATTQAVAMKMNRRFIGIEQMDYINEISVPRLQKVIAGEQGGISKEVNWQGGGSFVYTELMPKNMGYLQDVIHAKSLDELKFVYERMLSGTDTDEPADISFRADLSKIDWLQGFDENKRLLVKLLDKNGLYYNYSEIDDKNARDLISDEDYTFNKTFYEGGD
ncbi:DNA methyltransferase (plasmid) [Lactococcus formosensis subsp. formosensis]|uniref:DNA methyltransferase n=1 Tax=Lactococcus TaxID=1357 RepID=UPI0022E12EEA|nr:MULTISPECIES: DNA methyltransferase [Lactococcus]MDT2595359.1 DNA methyltransferase [Lactococcus petauri]MDT2896096.1 DNA methyltransferase [Lactococcus lactis]MDT2944181.1 DNA methyltransferase [Lactococcus lactis]